MQSIAERHSYIIDKLNQQGFVNINDLAGELGVTGVTIRSDLKILEEAGMLYRMRGGARTANPYVADLRVSVKDTINSDKKRLIAQRAVEMIESNDSLLIANGSTIYAFAEEIRKRHWSHLNVVTPFLRLGLLFNEIESIDVVQLGGRVHRESLSVWIEGDTGPLADCVCSKAFIGADGIDLESGITTSSIEEARLTRRMMKAATQTIVLVDSSKFGQHGFGQICAVEDIDMVVTDVGIPKQMVKILEDMGVDVIIAQ